MCPNHFRSPRPIDEKAATHHLPNKIDSFAPVHSALGFPLHVAPLPAGSHSVCLPRSRCRDIPSISQIPQIRSILVRPLPMRWSFSTRSHTDGNSAKARQRRVSSVHWLRSAGFSEVDTDWSRYKHTTDAGIFHETHEIRTGQPLHRLPRFHDFRQHFVGLLARGPRLNLLSPP